MSELTGKTVLITGASQGIGAAAARAFARTGARLALIARSEAPLSRLAEEIAKAGGTALPLVCDVARHADFADAIARAEAALGPLEVLINNAGVIEPIGHLLDVDAETWIAATDINFKGVYNGIRLALPGMVARGRGTIISVSSGAAHRPVEGWSHYCCAKAAAAMLTECAHLEYGDRLRILGLSPGTVATHMQEEIRASGVNAYSQLDPSAHISPAWVAQALVWLAGPEGAAFNGQEVSLRDETIRRRIGLG